MLTAGVSFFAASPQKGGRNLPTQPLKRVPHISILRCGHRAKHDRTPHTALLTTIGIKKSRLNDAYPPTAGKRTLQTRLSLRPAGEAREHSHTPRHLNNTSQALI